MASEAALITKFFGRFTSAASRTMSATASRSVAAAEIKASKAAAPVVAAASSPPSAAAIMAKTVSQTTSMSFRPSAFANTSAFI